LDELPKTHVGKIFKPDLRRMAIRRVYTDALRQKGINAEVRCIKDKKTGQIAIIKPKGGATEDQVAEVLNSFTGAWKIEDA
jgi:hypothetical protein